MLQPLHFVAIWLSIRQRWMCVWLCARACSSCDAEEKAAASDRRMFPACLVPTVAPKIPVKSNIWIHA